MLKSESIKTMDKAYGVWSFEGIKFKLSKKVSSRSLLPRDTLSDAHLLLHCLQQGKLVTPCDKNPFMSFVERKNDELSKAPAFLLTSLRNLLLHVFLFHENRGS